MKRIFNYIMLVLMILTLSSISLAKEYRNKNYLIKKTKTVKFKKNRKGYILYLLKKGRYRIIVDPGTVNTVDQYIYGEAEEFNPLFGNEELVYEIDTDKTVEVFKQEYKTNKTSKIKIQIEKIE